jgi:hypothetical protein
MEVAQAISKASSILDEERILPTTEYIDPLEAWQEEVTRKGPNATPLSIDVTKAMKGREKYGAKHLNLYTERGMRPRPVHESPYDYTFKSINFDLLKVLFNQIPDDDRGQFISRLLKRIPVSVARRPPGGVTRFPCYRYCMSELPLIVEFCIRMGYGQELLKAVGSCERPTIGLVILLLELEEIIALNFNLFSEQDLSSIVVNLHPLSVLCQNIQAKVRTERSRGMVNNSDEAAETGFQANEILESIGGIREECRKAKYYYTKDSLLQEMPNLEIESDKMKVISFLEGLGFDPLLTASLARADESYRSSDAFVLKDCLGHVRSFYEHLTIGGGQAIANNLNTTCLAEWDPTLTFLKNNSFLTTKQEKFARGLYTLLSDEGVHPLIAGREFARLLRNMVIEYGLMFLTMLEKKGVRV